MENPRLWQKIILGTLLALSSQLSIGQLLIRGTVYDRTRQFAMPGVSVLGTSGAGTATDSAGSYSIRLHIEDSIYFSYLGRFTMRFPVKAINMNQAFDMSLQIAVDSLPLVVVRPRSYRVDSALNRDEYRRIFEFGGGDYLGNSSGAGVGINLDALLSMKKIRRTEAFQKRLLEEERDKYVDHRFNKPLVRKITGLRPPALDTFMREYRPSYEFIQNCENDYEYYKYIKEWGAYFARQWRQDHPEDIIR